MYKIPKFIKPLKAQGKIEIYEKKNNKSLRRYIKCNSDVEIEDNNLGIFKLQKGKIYLFNMTTVGRNPVLARNNIWIAKRNLFYLQKKNKIKSTEENLRIIANSI